MVCYNCTTSTEEKTKTESNTCVNSTATENCSKLNNGYARITFELSTDRLEEIKDSLPKTYRVKEEPKFIDYLDGIDFDGTININQLTPDSEVSFSNVVSDERTGSITSTIANIILNEQYATLELNTAAININANSPIPIIFITSSILIPFL